MNAGSVVLRAMATAFAGSKAGRTGQGQRDWQMDLKALLQDAKCEDGEAHAQAIHDLHEAERLGLIQLDRHRHDRSLIGKARLPLGREDFLFEALRLASPRQCREKLAAQFAAAMAIAVPDDWTEKWQCCMSQYQQAALAGESMVPFGRDDLTANAELLELLPKLLVWEGESLIRFASCVLCGDSKRLEVLAPKAIQFLAQLSGGQIQSLEDIGILAMPRTVLLHGSLRLRLFGEHLDFGVLSGPVRLSQVDVDGSETVETYAQRCLTVENETTFQELSKLQSGELLIQTSFPGSATCALLKRLPKELEFWHFGDSDPEGFEILRDLRERTDLPFRSMLMHYRPKPDSPALSSAQYQQLKRLIDSPSMLNERDELQAILEHGQKGAFEQESLGAPPLNEWPFYFVNR